MKRAETETRGTFLVKILCRQNNSWQGEVLWAEQEEKRCFKSALELMKLIDKAMEEGAEDGLGRGAWQEDRNKNDMRKSVRQACEEPKWQE